MANAKYVFKVTAGGVTFNTGKIDEPVTFVRGAKDVASAQAIINNPNSTKTEWLTDNGRKMITVELTNVVSIDLTKVSTLKDRTAFLNAL